MAGYGRHGGKRAGKGLRGGVGCRDVSTGEIKEGKATLSPDRSEHREGKAPSTRTFLEMREDRKFTQPSNPLFVCAPKGELGLKEDLTPVWGHARRGKRQRGPIFYISQR